MVPDVREQLLSLGWRQGSIIEAGSIEHEVFTSHSQAAAFLILNQTCDLVNPSWDKEPFAELLPLLRIVQPNAEFLNGRNPRQIHFELTVDAVPCHVEALAPGIVTVERTLLLESNPSHHWVLGDPELKSLLAWRAARYLRTAFPDAFESRFGSVFRKFKKLIEKIHAHIDSLYIRVDPFERLGDGDPYEVDLLLVIRRISNDDTDTRAELNTSAGDLEKLINSADGLVCASCKVRSPHEVTLEEIGGYIRWERHDYLSFGEPD